MKKFLIPLCLFLLPVLLILGVFYYVLGASGEDISIAELQAGYASGEITLYGTAYYDNTAAIKFEQSKAKAAEVLVVGTSRSMQFSEDMFLEGTSFYNAGGSVSLLYEMKAFLEALGDAKPKTLILSLDQYFFNYNWWSEPYTESTYSASAQDHDLFEYGYTQFLRDIGAGKYDIVKLFNSEPSYYGMHAKINGRGFYADGSYTYGNAAINPEIMADGNFSESLRNIDSGTNRFEHGSEVSADSKLALEDLLAFCNSEGIEVIAYLPPYAPSVYAKMLASGNYAYMEQIAPAIQPMFEDYGFELYNFTNMSNVTDEMFLDGYHAGDRVYAQMLVEMPALHNIIDAETLQNAVNLEGNPRLMP